MKVGLAITVIVLAALGLRILVIPASTAAIWSRNGEVPDEVVLEFTPGFSGRHHLVVHTSGACHGLPVVSNATAENGRRWLPIQSTWEIVREGQRLAAGSSDRLALGPKGYMTILASERLDAGVRHRVSVTFTAEADVQDTCIEFIAVAIDFHRVEKHLVDAIVDCLLLIIVGVISVWALRRWRQRRAQRPEAQDVQS